MQEHNVAGPRALGLGPLLAYGLPAAPLGFMTSFASLYLLKFATDVLLVGPAVFASVFAVARIWDGLTDAPTGVLSDRTRHRLGRRRSWMLASALPLGVGFAAVWVPPEGLSGNALVVWMTAAILLYFTVYTTATIPHLALGAELSLDHHERSRVSAARGAFELIGFLVAAGCIGGLQASSDERAAAGNIALGFAFVAPLALLLSVAGTRERPEFAARGAASIRAAARDIANNRHGRIVILVFFLESLSLGFLATLFPFVTSYISPPGSSPASGMLLTLGIAITSVPLWLRASRRFGKRNTWLTAVAAKGTGFGLLYFVVDTGLWLPLIPMAMIGAGQACTSILPLSIKADVIDADEAATGDRKEGAYFAVWNLASKLAGAVAIGASGLLLTLAGFAPNVEQSPAAITAILALFSAVPFVLHLFAVAALLGFRLDAAEHARMRHQLDTKRGIPGPQAAGGEVCESPATARRAGLAVSLETP